MVSAVESGRRSFSGDLSAIGYSNDRLSIPPMSPPLHRTRASTLAGSKKRAQELLRLGGEVFKDLRERTDKVPKSRLERFEVMGDDDLEDLAVDVRSLLDHEEAGPIQNLTAAVEKAGVCLVPIVGLPGIDGLSAWVDGVPVIGLSPSVPGDRLRFSLSHELGHLLLHTQKGEHTEREANRFAGALLFPRSEFDLAMPDKPQLRDFIQLKKSWGVAVSALVYRAHELDHIDDRRYRALQIQMSKWRKNEPAGFNPVHGQLLSRLVEIHGGVPAVAADLGLNQSHVSELVNWSHLRVA